MQQHEIRNLQDLAMELAMGTAEDLDPRLFRHYDNRVTVGLSVNK